MQSDAPSAGSALGFPSLTTRLIVWTLSDDITLMTLRYLSPSS